MRDLTADSELRHLSLNTATVRTEGDLLCILDAAARQCVYYGVLTIEGDDYAFRHALVREAILSDLLPGEKAACSVARTTATDPRKQRLMNH